MHARSPTSSFSGLQLARVTCAHISRNCSGQTETVLTRQDYPDAQLEMLCKTCMTGEGIGTYIGVISKQRQQAASLVHGEQTILGRFASLLQAGLQRLRQWHLAHLLSIHRCEQHRRSWYSQLTVYLCSSAMASHSIGLHCHRPHIGADYTDSTIANKTSGVALVTQQQQVMHNSSIPNMHRLGRIVGLSRMLCFVYKYLSYTDCASGIEACFHSCCECLCKL